MPGLRTILGACALTSAVNVAARQVTVHTDPIAFLAKLGQLPEDQQETILKGAGKILMNKDPTITCNIFGGEESCKQLPADSDFGQACGKERDDLLIDCIFYEDAEKNMKLDPSEGLADALGNDYAKLKGHCPQCLINMQALWCVQVLPECGSFAKTVHSAVFPAIEQIKQKEDEGEAKSVAIAAAVPMLVKAFANMLGCREMCQAVVNTCSCTEKGDGMSFGDALEAAKLNVDLLQQFHPGLTVDELKTTIFKDLWDVPVCQVFTSKDDDDFIGECSMDAIEPQCNDDGFCKGLDDSKKSLVEAVIATKIARTILGFTHGAAGIAGQHSAIGQAAPETVPALPPSNKPSPPPAPLFPATKPDDPFTQSTEPDEATKARKQREHSSQGAMGLAASETGDQLSAEEAGNGTSKARTGVGAFFLAALVVTVLGAAGYFAFKYRQKQQLRRVFVGNYEALEEDGIPLT